MVVRREGFRVKLPKEASKCFTIHPRSLALTGDADYWYPLPTDLHYRSGTVWTETSMLRPTTERSPRTSLYEASASQSTAWQEH